MKLMKLNQYLNRLKLVEITRNLLLVIFIQNLISCDVRSAKSEIQKVKQQIITHEKSYDRIIKWVESHPEYGVFWITTDRQLKITAQFENDQGIMNINDKSFSMFVRSFLYDTNNMLIYIDLDRIAFTQDNRNTNLGPYFLIYLRKETYKFENIEYFESDRIPDTGCDWVYHIKNKWYLESNCEYSL